MNLCVLWVGCQLSLLGGETPIATTRCDRRRATTNNCLFSESEECYNSGGLQPPLGSPDLAPDADWASVREQRSSSNTLNRVPWSQSACSGGAGIPAGGPGRLPLENDDFGSVSGHLAQLAWSPPRRPPGGKFQLPRKIPRSRPASPPAAQRPPPRPPRASPPAAQGFPPGRPGSPPRPGSSQAPLISGLRDWPGHSGHSHIHKNMTYISLSLFNSITFHEARSGTI